MAYYHNIEIKVWRRYRFRRWCKICVCTFPALIWKYKTHTDIATNVQRAANYPPKYM